MKATLGDTISRLRKEKNMTQQQLADKMGVTDKAVSKWERNLSCPDIGSLPNLAEVLGVTVEELMQTKEKSAAPVGKVQDTIRLVLKAVALAMGIAVSVLSVLGSLDIEDGITMLGIGLACLGVLQLQDKP